MEVFCEPAEETCVVFGTGTCWPTKSLPVSLSRMLSWGAARTLASVVLRRNCTRKSMLIEPPSTPERRDVMAWATASDDGVLTVVFGPAPCRYLLFTFAMNELS